MHHSCVLLPIGWQCQDTFVCALALTSNPGRLLAGRLHFRRSIHGHFQLLGGSSRYGMFVVDMSPYLPRHWALPCFFSRDVGRGLRDVHRNGPAAKKKKNKKKDPSFAAQCLSSQFENLKPSWLPNLVLMNKVELFALVLRERRWSLDATCPRSPPEVGRCRTFMLWWLENGDRV